MVGAIGGRLLCVPIEARDFAFVVLPKALRQPCSAIDERPTHVMRAHEHRELRLRHRQPIDGKVCERRMMRWRFDIKPTITVSAIVTGRFQRRLICSIALGWARPSDEITNGD
jgi:hypothetical protein